ncbi:hypothetical protein SAMN05421687_103150 [Salimicrobium flavidum]|uniref:Uncharacterized protein n=1 Tax=Salimicrobium flavidum TaxID=570947 RepID=A0A1N7J0Y7_9BACI|nr:hypothetical protein SAMN05421687_103150 [Salimicrobium flavidum]
MGSFEKIIVEVEELLVVFGWLASPLCLSSIE